MHHDPVTPVVLALALVLTVAKLGGHLAARLGQPAVLGELVAGVVLGNLGLAGMHGFDFIAHEPAIDILARIGVIILLFEVGLESTVRQMMAVGAPSLLVAVLGIVAPFALGWGVGAWLLPEHSTYAHAFLGATLTATSVGITARVLKDLGRSQSAEARVILGAAVIDDVLGLIILAVMSGIVAAIGSGGSLSLGTVLWVTLTATGFLVGAMVAGPFVSPRLFRIAARVRGSGILLTTALAFCFVLSYLSAVAGLAPIVGAYAAGLVLEDVHYREFVDRGERPLRELVQPIAGFLVPVFFVVMGARVELAALAEPGTIWLALALTAAAVIGKQACALGAIGGRLDRLSIALGMMPRGEVGLIFAAIGAGLVVNGEPVINRSVFAAVVIMVGLTTFATPPALKWSLARGRRRASGASGEYKVR